MSNEMLEHLLEKIQNNAEMLESKLSDAGFSKKEVPELYAILDAAANSLSELDNLSLDDLDDNFYE